MHLSMMIVDRDVMYNERVLLYCLCMCFIILYKQLLSDTDTKELTHLQDLMCSHVANKLAFDKVNKQDHTFVDLQSYVTL
jgi:hypothetical protein